MPTQELPKEQAVAEATTPSSKHHLATLEMHSSYRIGLAYGRQVYRLRWIIIALWVVALFVSLPFAGKLSSVLKSGGYTFSSSDSVRVADITIQKLHQPPSQVIAVFHSTQATTTDPTYQSEMHELAQ